jgi:predicted PurR-regulated permease PerM
VLGLVLLVLPLSVLATSLAETAAALAGRLRGDLVVPAPPPGLAAVPLIGEPLTRLWSLATTNLGAALAQLAPHLRPVGDWVLGLVADAGFGVLHFVAAIIVAGILLAHAGGAAAAAHRIATRLVGERGPRLAALAEGTIRNVTRGLLGTAAIQSLLAGLGFVVAGVPGAAILTLVCFVLCVVQLGPAIVLLGAVVWMFATADPITASLFTVWAVLVALIDNVLRPYLLSGRGGVPLLVVLIGVLGGLLAHGLIGLFVGPIVFALGYELLRAWALDGGGEA